MIKFIDISNHQEEINVLTVVKNGGLSAVIVKATEGIGWTDKSCDGFVQTCIKNGIPFGFYHFARNNDPYAEAEYFRNETKGYEGKGIPVLDWEDGQSVDWVNKFIDRYHALTGVWPWVYGNAWRFNEGTVNTNCGRWIAGYPLIGKDEYPHDIDYGLENKCTASINNGSIVAWQFSSQVNISGYGDNLDGNVFYGDVTAWNKYAGTGVTPSTPTPAPTPSAPTGTTLELVAQVMEGKFGDGDDRENALGSRYTEVQEVVNHILLTDAQTLADEVWQGKYGNDPLRKRVLGTRYTEVMKF